jgi:3,4-dihydroxy 2-butanone 4-phosphate synthase/GTP cyclohydrolase II
MNFSSIEQALEAIRKGGIVIVVDDEDRENEGDFICAAETLTAEKVNFMLKARGLFCVTLTEERASELKLKPAVDTNTALHGTAFTVSVDHKSVHTGISAQDRAATALALADAATKPEDLVRPGHIFPIVARDGGVLKRAGHTEASVDLARLAGFKPAGVLIEILNEDGSMARRERLHEIARQHGMPIVTIADLIRYRYRHERLVKRVAEAALPTSYGEFRVIGYEVWHDPQEPIALVKGEITKVGAPLVRVHSSCFTGDLLESLRCDCGDQLHLAMAMIANEGVGAIVYLPQEGRGIGIIEKIKAYQLQDKGLDTVEANLALGHVADMRDYGIGIQIIKDLGLSKVRLLTNNPKKTDAFIYYGYDLTVVDQLPLIAPSNPEIVRYLDAKRKKLGHRLQSEFGSRSVLHSDGL